MILSRANGSRLPKPDLFCCFLRLFFCGWFLRLFCGCFLRHNLRTSAPWRVSQSSLSATPSRILHRLRPTSHMSTEHRCTSHMTSKAPTPQAVHTHPRARPRAPHLLGSKRRQQWGVAPRQRGGAIRQHDARWREEGGARFLSAIAVASGGSDHSRT